MGRPNDSMMKDLPGYQAGIDCIPAEVSRHLSECSCRFRTPAETRIVCGGSLKENEQKEKGRRTWKMHDVSGKPHS
jgi:hypothetical protein